MRLFPSRLWYKYICSTVSIIYEGAAAPTSRPDAHNFLSVLLRAASQIDLSD